jgi:hypothetical protein
MTSEFLIDGIMRVWMVSHSEIERMIQRPRSNPEAGCAVIAPLPGGGTVR